ncbi:hypothetical protein DFH09DRAFT_1330319 [Mycena vulgaris]|nr:hypothetical protein DFH09DRAFT_1330319 [Mycena vulgaris]
MLQPIQRRFRRLDHILIIVHRRSAQAPTPDPAHINVQAIPPPTREWLVIVWKPPVPAPVPLHICLRVATTPAFQRAPCGSVGARARGDRGPADVRPARLGRHGEGYLI